jgi:hypothetical protein
LPTLDQRENKHIYETIHKNKNLSYEEHKKKKNKKKKKKNKYIIINSTTIEVSRNAIHHSTKIEYEIEISIWKSVINNQIFEVK